MTLPYDTIFEMALAPMCVLDLDGQIVTANRALRRYMGSELDRRPRFTSWIATTDRPNLEVFLRKSHPRLSSTSMWATFHTAEGAHMRMYWKLTFVPEMNQFLAEGASWPGGLLQPVGGAATRIQDSEGAADTLEAFQELLSQSVLQLADRLGNANYVVALHDPETTEYVYVSPGVENLMGLKASELYGTTPYSFFHQDDLSKLSLDHRNKQKGEDPNRAMKFRRRMPDGSYRHSESVSRPVMDHEGHVLFILSITHDAGPVEE